MALTVTHSVVATGTDSGDQVSKNAWNADHVLVGSSLEGTPAGAGDTGGSVTLTGGTGNDGASEGASIIVGGGTGGGDMGEVVIVGSTVTFGEGGAGTSIQTTANDVTIANAPLRLDDGLVAVTIRSGSADPSAGGGVAASIGSLFLRDDGAGVGELWVKTGAADTAWTKVV